MTHLKACVWCVCGVRVACVWCVCGVCVVCVWRVCGVCVSEHDSVSSLDMKSFTLVVDGAC